MGAGARLLVDVSYLVGAMLYLPVMTYQAFRHKKHRSGWGERFGRLPRLTRSGPRVWIHAVSMGEVNAASGLVAALKDFFPGLDFVITTTTDTGYERARRLFADHEVYRYPLDFGWVVRRALDAIEPDMIVLVELEVWYNLVTRAAARGIPVCVVNGRLSARSRRRFSWIRPVARTMFDALTWVGAQDEVYAERFRALGVRTDRIDVTGSVKWDTATVSDHVEGVETLAASMGIDRTRPLWIGGSTGEREEAFLLSAHARLSKTDPELQLAIVPRKPERFDEVARLIEQQGFRCVRRSRNPDGTESPRQTSTVFLGDTMGEIRKFYALGDVVFVGRTLNGWGGSDPMEVAALGCPIVVGPYTQNFQDAVDKLEANDALRRVTCAEQLPAVVASLLSEPGHTGEMAQRARQTVRENQGATTRTARRLVSFLNVTPNGSA